MNLVRNLLEGRPQAVQRSLAWWDAAGGPSVPAVVAQTLQQCGGSDAPCAARLAEQALHVASNVAASALRPPSLVARRGLSVCGVCTLSFVKEVCQVEKSALWTTFAIVHTAPRRWTAESLAPA